MSDGGSPSETRLGEAVEEKRSEATKPVEDDAGTQRNVDDPLFEYKEGVFRNKEMVRVGWVPEGGRIVGRDDYIKHISSLLNDAVFGEAPDHIAITGKTGTGKTLVSRFVAQRAQAAAVEDVRLSVVYVDCSEATTVTQLISYIGQQLNDPSFYETKEDAIRMPDAGLSRVQFYDRFWKILDNYDSAIFILDEVDLLDDDLILMNFAKAVEKRATNCKIGIVGISNIIGFFDNLNARTQSAFQTEEIVFSPYDATQLIEILEGRRDAFHEGALEDGVIELVAALSAQEHGDARKAMRLYRTAGEIAERENADIVKEKHVRAAQTKLEKDEFREFLDDTPTHMQIVSAAIAGHTKFGKRNYTRTGTLYTTYESLAEAADITPITIRRVREILNEMSLHRVLESRVNPNVAGESKEHRLLHDPDVVTEIVLVDTRFDDLTKSTLRDCVQKTIRNEDVQRTHPSDSS